MNQAGAVRLEDAGDAARFGGKSAALANAVRAGLPVPRGVALPWELTAALAGDEDAARRVLADAATLAPFLAVRSSAVGEDSAAASFAGQHLTRLNVPVGELENALRAVVGSLHAPGPRAYRRRLEIGAPLRMAIVIQEMLAADVSGALFHPHPLTGADEIVVEASWGLGETVVGGLVVPDAWRLAPDGTVLEARPGIKDVEVAPSPSGGTESRPVPPERVHVPCLDETFLAGLVELWSRCVRVFDGPQDLEWCFANGALWLLQRRPATRVAGGETR